MKIKQTDNLLVRDATENDLEALIGLKNPEALHRDRLRDAQQPTFRYLVVEVQNQVIGFGCLVFARPSSWSDSVDIDHLPQMVDLLIAPIHRGQGRGTYLIQKLEQIALGQGETNMYVAVDPIDNPRAHKLYHRLGYQALQNEPYLKHWEFTDSSGVVHAGDDWIIDLVKNL